uniref:Uncharacterized protein n=1 Tax=Anguilla anguilla TaxID=7936 RepID=A0A0E9U976_ANGAN
MFKHPTSWLPKTQYCNNLWQQ